MDDHGKKIIAPVVVTIFMVLYFIFYFTMIIRTVTGLARVLLGIIPLAFTLVMVAVCVQRIKEIRSGEEDDLGKY